MTLAVVTNMALQGVAWRGSARFGMARMGKVWAIGLVPPRFELAATGVGWNRGSTIADWRGGAQPGAVGLGVVWRG